MRTLHSSTFILPYSHETDRGTGYDLRPGELVLALRDDLLNALEGGLHVGGLLVGAVNRLLERPGDMHRRSQRCRHTLGHDIEALNLLERLAVGDVVLRVVPHPRPGLLVRLGEHARVHAIVARAKLVVALKALVRVENDLDKGWGVQASGLGGLGG